MNGAWPEHHYAEHLASLLALYVEWRNRGARNTANAQLEAAAKLIRGWRAAYPHTADAFILATAQAHGIGYIGYQGDHPTLVPPLTTWPIRYSTETGI